VPRRYSPVTQAAGASHSPLAPVRASSNAKGGGPGREVEPEIERQQEHADRPQRRRQPAEGHQHSRRPVQRAAEVDDRRHQTEQEPAAGARARQRSRAPRPAAQGEKERDQRNPCAGGWPNLGKLSARSAPARAARTKSRRTTCESRGRDTRPARSPARVQSATSAARPPCASRTASG
jgi:hypothetical protein